MLKPGDYEGFFNGDRVAVKCRNRMIFVYRNGKWNEVSLDAVDVVFTLRQYENGKLRYTTTKVFHTPRPHEIPIELPLNWMKV